MRTPVVQFAVARADIFSALSRLLLWHYAPEKLFDPDRDL
jgi:hypothetical protein